MAAVTSISLIPLVAAAGGSIDLMRITATQSKLQAALDSGVLAAASLTNKGDIDTVVKDYIEANLPDGKPWDTLQIEPVKSDSKLNAKKVEVTANVTVKTPFLSVIKMNEAKVMATAIAEQNATNIELSLVLDISSSMQGSKLEALKAAAAEFVDTVIKTNGTQTTSVNLVPFGGTVNIGDIYDARVTPSASATWEPTEAQYDIGDDVADGDFRFAASGNCVELVEDDFDLSEFPDGTRPQVPHFWKWNNFAPWCPLEESGILLNTNDSAKLKARIAEMILSDGTGMDIGALWGARALSPLWKSHIGGDFADRPAAFGTEETLKVMVLMTDGNITSQYRPEDPARLNTHTNRSNNGDPKTSHYGNRGNNRNEQTILSRGNASALPTSDTAVGRFKRICDQLGDEEVQIYTIGFQINANSIADQLLQYCASTERHYYFVETLDIGSAFDSIAVSVSSLRISG